MFHNFSPDSKYIHFSLKISFRFVFENLKSNFLSSPIIINLTLAFLCSRLCLFLDLQFHALTYRQGLFITIVPTYPIHRPNNSVFIFRYLALIMSFCCTQKAVGQHCNKMKDQPNGILVKIEGTE